jgi:hypothetical protein
MAMGYPLADMTQIEQEMQNQLKDIDYVNNFISGEQPDSLSKEDET